MGEMSEGLNKTLKSATNPVGSAMDGVKSAAKSLTDLDPESETGKLAAQKAERAEDVKRIQASTARAAAERKQREAAEALAKAEAAEAKLATGPEKSDT